MSPSQDIIIILLSKNGGRDKYLIFLLDTPVLLLVIPIHPQSKSDPSSYPGISTNEDHFKVDCTLFNMGGLISISVPILIQNSLIQRTIPSPSENNSMDCCRPGGIIRILYIDRQDMGTVDTEWMSGRNGTTDHQGGDSLNETKTRKIDTRENCSKKN